MENHSWKINFLVISKFKVKADTEPSKYNEEMETEFRAEKLQLQRNAYCARIKKYQNMLKRKSYPKTN